MTWGTAAQRYNNLEFYPEKGVLYVKPDDSPIRLPPTAAKLLGLFLSSTGKCVSRTEIETRVWDGVTVSPRTIDSHVCRLRKHLAGAEASIECVYGGGYIFA